MTSTIAEPETRPTEPPTDPIGPDEPTEPPAEPQGAPHAMRVVDGTGDTKIEWDVNNPAEVDAARAVYAKLVTNGQHRAFRMDRGEPGEQMDEFDPQAREILITGALQGG